MINVLFELRFIQFCVLNHVHFVKNAAKRAAPAESLRQIAIATMPGTGQPL